ncbi:hypothetical protein CUD01_25260 [Cellulomonas uda]|uniref:Uncharacterized protein n=1 Tax=Cellulomonas uda TaxID=1714 RepID=A0A4Y3KDN4_CELUD|nr:hypothetical protein CUD01_25260 [Cellulomonas uda]
MRHVAQQPHPPTPADRDDPAVRAALQVRGRRDRHPHHRHASRHGLNPDPVQAEQNVTASTGIGRWAHVGAPRSVRHVEVLEMDRVAWSLLILGDLDPYPPLNPPNPSLPTGTARIRKTDLRREAETAHVQVLFGRRPPK